MSRLTKIVDRVINIINEGENVASIERKKLEKKVDDVEASLENAINILGIYNNKLCVAKGVIIQLNVRRQQDSSMHPDEEVLKKCTLNVKDANTEAKHLENRKRGAEEALNETVTKF